MKVYLDNSATSWPKPDTVVKAMSSYLHEYGASPGRSGHGFSLRAAREVFETRELLAQLFNVPSSENVIFTANATHALNIAIKGLLKKGDHVIISHMEHNSVLRPLKFMENQGLIELSIVECLQDGSFNIELFKKSFKPATRMVVTLHGSNVSGNIFPIRQIGEICHQNNALYLVDAAQTAGFLPIDLMKDNIDLIAFTGHKKLLGPPGTGGLCFRNDLLIETMVHGGTGSKSESELHPEFYPDRLEAGTPNTVGIIGLKAGIEYILNEGMENLLKKQIAVTSNFISGLKEIERVILYGPDAGEERLPLVSMNICGLSPSDLALALDDEYGIMVRAGLHCSPLAHKTLGTFPQGAVRFGIGCFSTEEEIEYTIQAIKMICKKTQK
jgi:cysteine desulfurase / selenocysteine lyase